MSHQNLTIFLSSPLGRLVGDDFADVLDDKRAPLDVLQGLDPPPAPVGGPVDAEFDLPSLLNHPVVAGRTAAALLVALVNRGTRVDPEPTELVVRHHVTVRACNHGQNSVSRNLDIRYLSP